MNVLEELRELLIPVFGLDTIDEVQAEQSLVSDLGATSIDFVEISYLIESTFNVTIKTNELMIGGNAVDPNEVFIEGKLSAEGAALLNKNMNTAKFTEGQTQRQLYESITVADLAYIVEIKMDKDS